MAEVVRDGAGHAADGGEALGCEEVFLGALQLDSHALEGAAELADFFGSIVAEAVGVVAFAESARAFDEVCEGAGDRARDGLQDCGAGAESEQAEERDPAVDAPREHLSLVKGFEHDELRRVIRLAGARPSQRDRGGQIFLRAELDGGLAG